MRLADFVAEVFCPSECVRLIQDQASMRNVDSRIHSLRFACCVFLFYSFSAVTFATKSALRDRSMRRTNRVAIGGKADMLQWDWLGAIRCSVPTSDRFGLRQLERR